jgi:hypothetical protein
VPVLYLPSSGYFDMPEGTQMQEALLCFLHLCCVGDKIKLLHLSMR